MAEIEGAVEMASGMEDLQVAREVGAIGVAEVVAGASDLTRAADAAIVANRAQELSEIVVVVMKGGNVRAMGAIVSMLSREELERDQAGSRRRHGAARGLRSGCRAQQGTFAG